MIELLIDWRAKNLTSLEAAEIESALHEPQVDRDKTAARVDFSRAGRIGTVILWSNGDCELDALNPAGNDMVSEYREIKSADDLEAAVTWVLERL